MGVRAGLVGVLLAATPALAAPAKSRPLPAPAIEPGPRTFVALAGQPAPIVVRWAAVPGATGYRARWTSSGTELDLPLPAATTELARPEATAGHHRLAVTALDGAGGEGAPAEIAIDVVAVTAIAPGADQAEPASAFAVGARFAAPGLRCQLGDSARGDEAVATRAGNATLRCGGEAGQPSIEVPVVIAPIVIDAHVAPIWRGVPTTLHVSVASVAPIGGRLAVESIGELDTGDAERTAGGIDVPVTADRRATTATLVIRAAGVELGRVAIPLADPPPTAAPATTSRLQWRALDLGAQIGAFMMPGTGREASALGKPMATGDTLSSGPLAGLRLGLFPTRTVGLELEAALATPSYVGRFGVAAMLVSRAQLAARVVDDARYGLRLLAGADLLTVLTEGGSSQPGTTGGVHYGAAFTVETRPRVAVRFQALDVITVAQDAGYAHGIELTVGVVTRLGRRDRWR